MFERILQLTESYVGDLFFLGPRRRDEPSEEEWESTSKILVRWLGDYARGLQASAQVALGPKLFEHSKMQFFWYPKRGPEVCVVQYRPVNSYYHKQNKPIPRPENPEGPGATGIALTVKIVPDYTGPSRGGDFCVVLCFEVWGNEERVAVQHLYGDYRRLIQRLVDSVKPEFETSRVFSSLESYRGKRASRMLELYMDEEDDEGYFKLSKSFFHGDSPDEVVKTFQVFAALYDASYHYIALSPKQRDQILLHFFRLQARQSL